MHDSIQAQSCADLSEPLVFGPVAHDAKLKARNPVAQLRGRLKQGHKPLSGIKTAHGQNRKPLLIGPSGICQKQVTPGIEIDQLRYNDRALNAVKFFDALGTIPAWSDDEIGAPRVLCLQPGMKRHAGSRESGFKKYCLTQNAFDTRDMRRRIAPSSNRIAVCIDADCSVRMEIACTQVFIEQNACGR